MKKVLLNRDFVSGVFMLLFSALLFSQAIWEDGEAMLFPEIVALVSCICGAAACISAFKREADGRGWGRYFGADAALAVLLFLLCMLAGKLGFYTCMFAVCLAVTGILQLKGRKNLWNCLGKTVLLSILIMAGMYLIFHVVLSLITPVGMFV